METLAQLGDGFLVALTWKNLFYCTVGALFGTIVGILPGVGPLAGMSLLLPLTFKLDPTAAIIMMAGIFSGAMYGGSTTSILMRIPGEAASVITCIDGYEMARRGRAGPALVVAALGSFIGGTISIVGLILFAPPLASAMLTVGPAAEFILMMMALGVVTLVSSGSALKTLAMVLVGLLLAMIGYDQLTGLPRFTFGRPDLGNGLNFVAVAIGLFGISEILLSLEDAQQIKPMKPRLRELLPRVKDLRASAGPIARGSLIGFVFGIVPGVSHVTSTFISYVIEKKLSRRPEEFGHGAIAGVAGPETANNATTGSALIPLLVLGIPAIPSTAILLTALTIHGVQAGPLMMSEHPEVFWGLIASLYIGNLVLLVLNLPFVGMFVNLLRIPYGWLAPMIIVVCIVGVYSVSLSQFDLFVMGVFGVLGYLLRKYEYDMAPLLMALVLGDRMEIGFRRALTISAGDYGVFVTGPAARVFLCAFGLILALQAGAWALGFRRKAVTQP
jgi:putative tricarboxylic transport membrane protein